MREFYVIKKDGTGMIIDEIELEQSSKRNFESIDETEDSVVRNNLQQNDDVDYDKVYAKFFKEVDMSEGDLEIRDKINTTITLVNKSTTVGMWDKKFVYGLKSKFSKGKKKPTRLQMETLEKILAKLA